MSQRRHHRQERHLCAECRAHKAKYRYRGHVRADRQHVLCFQCYRSARERMRARALADVIIERPAPLRYDLTERQISHRRTMLEHLTAQAAVRAVNQGPLGSSLNGYDRARR